MRILNQDSGKTIKSVLIMLTPSEAHELSGKLRCINPEIGDHIHVNDENFTHELTLSIYTPDNLDIFVRKIREIIEEDV
ncbi:MAG: hypothetical protein JW908_09450 [Anaerolineales bacterium]|nr:hypothetical protein [Anaerolineales bacterium]